MKRRTLLQLMAATAATLRWPLRLRAQNAALTPADQVRLKALAEVVLPSEIGPAAQEAAVRGFLRWHADYRAGVETDHGYGFPRLRRTGGAPSARYASHLAALDADARRGGRSFADLPVLERRVIVEVAVAAAKVERLPARPDGAHVATDLMSFYFNSIEGQDVCYRARIGRDTCRRLAGSDQRPAPLGGRDANR
ncbi:MAG: hypothetical protein ACT4QD_21970 [Acidobacteriota bacterium]